MVYLTSVLRHRTFIDRNSVTVANNNRKGFIMNIQSEKTAKIATKSWVKKAVEAARSECPVGGECTRAEASPDLVRFAADEVKLGMLDVVTDEIPGMDEAMGEPGKVVVNGVTTNFARDGSVTEFTRSCRESDVQYAKLDTTNGKFDYILVSNREGQGTRYDGMIADEGAYYNKFIGGVRAVGLIKD